MPCNDEPEIKASENVGEGVLGHALRMVKKAHLKTANLKAVEILRYVESSMNSNWPGAWTSAWLTCYQSTCMQRDGHLVGGNVASQDGTHLVSFERGPRAKELDGFLFKQWILIRIPQYSGASRASTFFLGATHQDPKTMRILSESDPFR